MFQDEEGGGLTDKEVEAETNTFMFAGERVIDVPFGMSHVASDPIMPVASHQVTMLNSVETSYIVFACGACGRDVLGSFMFVHVGVIVGSFFEIGLVLHLCPTCKTKGEQDTSKMFSDWWP